MLLSFVIIINNICEKKKEKKSDFW